MPNKLLFYFHASIQKIFKHEKHKNINMKYYTHVFDVNKNAGIS